MNTTAVLIALLILALVILLGNVMIAVAFLRGRKIKTKSSETDGNAAMDQLHQRVQELTRKPK